MEIVNNVHWAVKRVIYSGVYTETWNNIGDGGPECYYEMTNQYRFTIAAIWVTIPIVLTQGLYSIPCFQTF